MKAMIIYDQIEFATEARAMLNQASKRTVESARWHVRLWRVDMLNLPPVAADALADAADAHLVVLAMHPFWPLPRCLTDWLEEWARRRQVPDAAVAAFGGTSFGLLPPSVSPELSRFADRHRLSLILAGSGHGEEEPVE